MSRTKSTGIALAAALVAAAASAESGDARAYRNYVLHCAGCHQLDGSGAPEEGVPVMRGVLGAFQEVPGGREYLVQVPGVMNSGLSDHQVAELMNWLIPQMAGREPAYTAAEIARLRASRPVDIALARLQLIEKMSVGRRP
ncbi:MAG: cytochrome c [Azonexus sp.]|nr:cytochrome c [Azonexus sp.]